MKVEELRIGNLINGIYYEYENDEESEEIENETICKVVALDVADMCEYRIYVESEEADIEIFSEFKPIPLTEEWLWNFGFEKTEWDNFNSFRRTIGNNDYAIILYSDGNCEVGDIITCKIEYVHQLQNLYFALTGEELKKQPQ
jgi:hypothetical protein